MISFRSKPKSFSLHSFILRIGKYSHRFIFFPTRLLSFQSDDDVSNFEAASKLGSSTDVLLIGNYAKIDLSRKSRAGFPEVIFGSGKDANHLANIMHSMQKRMENNTIIATRVSAEQYSVIEALLGSHAVQYRSECRIAHTVSVSQTPSNNSQTESISGSVAVLCAGTSDVAVAEEAAVLLELSGVSQVTRVYDVGVAGIHRLLSNLDKFNRADVVIVCAGMDGALPSVVGGLVQAPVIAVPTSVGYGASFQGVSALLTMLNSCAPGVTVVNIDNGFGAAVSAYKMLRLKQQNKNINNDKK